MAKPYKKRTNNNKRNKGKGQVQRQREILNIVQKPGESDAAFVKRKNALYVRRSYHRQKLEIQATQGVVAEAKQHNAALRAEQERLTKLLQQAKAIEMMISTTTTTTMQQQQA